MAAIAEQHARIDLTDYRASSRELARVGGLMSMVPEGLDTALDIGARDGFLSRLLAARVQHVTALDLEQPTFTHPRVTCVKGDATEMTFARRSFDLVLCAEVLEHIPALEQACEELQRVSAKYLLIGVPYRQDIRLGRTTCQHCGARNPPWGHVNSFDEARLEALFPEFVSERVEFVDATRERSNWLAAALLDYAGNPFGTYCQQEPCGACGKHVGQPRARSFAQKVATKIGVNLQRAHSALSEPRGNWIHMLLRRVE